MDRLEWTHRDTLTTEQNHLQKEAEALALASQVGGMVVCGV